MFNVMVTAADNAWEEGAYVWHNSRILEYTEEVICDRLKGLSAETLESWPNCPRYSCMNSTPRACRR
jgi:hypothetical protein